MKKIVMDSGRAFEITKANWGPPAPAMKGEYRFERGAVVEVDDADAGALLDPKQRAWFGGRVFRPATAADEAPPASAGITTAEAEAAMAAVAPIVAGADPLASKGAPGEPEVAKRGDGEPASGKAGGGPTRAGA